VIPLKVGVRVFLTGFDTTIRGYRSDNDLLRFNAPWWGIISEIDTSPIV
jgi:hypothetical protein